MENNKQRQLDVTKAEDALTLLVTLAKNSPSNGTVEETANIYNAIVTAYNTLHSLFEVKEEEVEK